MSALIKSTVTLVATPPTGGSGADGSSTFAFQGGGTFAHFDSSPFKATGGDTAIALGPIAKVKVLYAKADSPCLLKLTHADGADEVVPLDKVVYIESPSKPITGIKVNGTATGVIAIAGDEA